MDPALRPVWSRARNAAVRVPACHLRAPEPGPPAHCNAAAPPP